jgi:hypothetical protein
MVVIAGIHGAAGPLIESRIDATHRQCGIALEADVQLALGSEPLFARLSGQLGDLLGRGVALSLRLSRLDSRDGEIQFRRFCERLSAALDAPGEHTAALEITLPAGRASPEFAWQVRQETLGTGRLNIICDDSCHADDGFWLQLWRLRCEQQVTVALWPILRGPSALMPTERAGNIEPVSGLQVPTESAWFAASLQLRDLLTPDAALDEAKTTTVLVDMLASLDAAHENAEWPTPAMQQDAWLNRRLAVHVEGAGNVIDDLRLDPAAPASRKAVREMLQRIRRTLKVLTRQMARQGQLLPAIEVSNPVRGLAAGPARDRWELRWQHAVARGAVRHRNLLAMSPWSLFPDNCADRRYFGLATLLSEADSCLFRGRPSLLDWNPKDFKYFYQSVWAVRRRVEAEALIAERL